eukprot:7608127-Alexandrium_andersonii.AAC.1
MGAPVWTMQGSPRVAAPALARQVLEHGPADRSADTPRNLARAVQPRLAQPRTPLALQLHLHRADSGLPESAPLGRGRGATPLQRGQD